MVIEPFIVKQIVEEVIRQMEDADYDGKAMVDIGNTFILIDKDEFCDLQEYLERDVFDKSSISDILDMKFEDIVKSYEEIE